MSTIVLSDKASLLVRRRFELGERREKEADGEEDWQTTANWNEERALFEETGISSVTGARDLNKMTAERVLGVDAKQVAACTAGQKKITSEARQAFEGKSKGAPTLREQVYNLKLESHRARNPQPVP